MYAPHSTSSRLAPPLLLLLFLSGCDHPPVSSLEGRSSSPDHASPVKIGVAIGGGERRGPLRVGVAVDKTGSSTPNGVGLVKGENFSSLLELLRLRGGDIGVGLIREDSNKPLLRLRIDPPVREGSADVPENPYERVEFEAKEKEAAAGRANKIDAQLLEFTEKLQSLLSIPADAKKTDICSAIERVDLFLQEDDKRWGNIDRYAVFVTDGIDNVSAKPCTKMASNTTALLVRGVGGDGVFKGWEILTFEGLDAAFSWIESSQRGGK
jgi:hypothetical protein